MNTAAEGSYYVIFSPEVNLWYVRTWIRTSHGESTQISHLGTTGEVSVGSLTIVKREVRQGCLAILSGRLVDRQTGIDQNAIAQTHNPFHQILLISAVDNIPSSPSQSLHEHFEFITNKPQFAMES